MENTIDKIISFAKEKQQTDVNSHRGAYQTIIDYCKALRIHDVSGRSEQCCSPTDGFYLGTTCPHCNKPFRKDVK